MEMDFIQEKICLYFTLKSQRLFVFAVYYDYYIKLAAGRFSLNYTVTQGGKKLLAMN